MQNILRGAPTDRQRLFKNLLMGLVESHHIGGDDSSGSKPVALQGLFHIHPAVVTDDINRNRALFKKLPDVREQGRSAPKSLNQRVKFRKMIPQAVLTLKFRENPVNQLVLRLIGLPKALLLILPQPGPLMVGLVPSLLPSTLFPFYPFFFFFFFLPIQFPSH